MGQIVLWDDFSHKGNESLIAICDFISNTGEYIKHNGLPHPKGCSPAVFKGVSVHTARKSPPTLPILQDLVREAPPHAKGTTPSKYLRLQTDGNSSKVPLVGHSSPHHYKFVKEDALNGLSV